MNALLLFTVVLIQVTKGGLLPVTSEDYLSCQISVFSRKACKDDVVDITDEKECIAIKDCCYRNDSQVGLKCYKKAKGFHLQFQHTGISAKATRRLLNRTSSRPSIRSISHDRKSKYRVRRRECPTGAETCGLKGTLQRDCERLFCCWDEAKQKCFRQPIYHRPRIPQPDEFYLSFLESQSKASLEENPSCPSNGLAVSDSCFFPLVKNQLSFKDSERACNTFGGNLAQIRSTEMYEIVAAHIRNYLNTNYESHWPLFLDQTFLWIGSLYRNDDDVVLLGHNDAIKNASESWMNWYPGSPVNNSMFNRLS